MQRLIRLLASIACLSVPGVGTAQVLEYIDCEVRDPASFTAAIEHFFESMSGGFRPSMSIDWDLWNGSSPATHTVIIAYENHRELETFVERLGDNPVFAQLLASVGSVATCANEGLAVQIGAWGNQDAPWEYYAVYPVTTTDGAAYTKAFEDYAESIVDEAPGPIQHYQNRAGEEGVTNFVVFLSPSLASLNEFLDNLTASDAYADFVDEVADIRTLGTATQAQRLITFEP
jgi:hypothetical protein